MKKLFLIGLVATVICSCGGSSSSKYAADSTDVESSPKDSRATSSASEVRKRAMYEAGKSWAKLTKSMSEETFKERYQLDCNDDEVTNRTLYEEYKRGFYDGVKELQGL